MTWVKNGSSWKLWRLTLVVLQDMNLSAIGRGVVAQPVPSNLHVLETKMNFIQNELLKKGNRY